MSARRGALAFAIVFALGTVALLVAATRDQRPAAFSLDVAAGVPVGTLAPARQMCQTPVQRPADFSAIQVWIGARHGRRVAMTISVRSSTGGPPLAIGEIAATSRTASEYTSTLSRTIPAGSPLTICLRADGPGTAVLIGAAPTGGSGRLRTTQRPDPVALAMVLLRPHPHSLLSLIPSVFARAALFRPGWVGSWTFWGLTVALLGACALAAAAVTSAGRSDEIAGGSSADE